MSKTSQLPAPGGNTTTTSTRRGNSTDRSSSPPQTNPIALGPYGDTYEGDSVEGNNSNSSTTSSSSGREVGGIGGAFSTRRVSFRHHQTMADHRPHNFDAHARFREDFMYEPRRSSASAAGLGGFPELEMLSTHRHESAAAADSSTIALDAAILDLTRRRLSVAVPPNNLPDPSGPHGRDVKWDTKPAGGYTHSSAFSARHKQLQQQQKELEQRQKELEIQRQQLLAGMQEHAKSTSLFAAQHSAANFSAESTSQQQWWVCQVCNTKAFASHDEAMQHELTCCPEPHKFDSMAPIMSTSMHVPADYMPMPHLADYSPDHSEHGMFDSGVDPRLEGHMDAHDLHGEEIDLEDRLEGRLEVHEEPLVAAEKTKGRTKAAKKERSRPTLPPLPPLPPLQLPPLTHTGPFALMEKPMALSMVSDKDWLTPLHCFVRRHCVQVFTASENDVSTPSKGKRRPIQVGQVGIRCPHCFKAESKGKSRERGSVYYPTSIASIYNATMNLLQRHLHNCTSCPDKVMRRYEMLKSDDARSGTSKRYWIESALSLGLVDTPDGIRFSLSTPPPLPSMAPNGLKETNGTSALSDEAPSLDLPGSKDKSNASAASSKEAALVTPEDEPVSTKFSFHLISQMQPCVFTEADRLGKRKGLPSGFPGLACRHCFGGFGSGRFFPSSIKTLSDTSKTLNVLHNHMMRCRKCPRDIREKLDKLRDTHDEERSQMKFGSQKAFFARVWERLHGSNKAVEASTKAVTPETPPPEKRKRKTSSPPGGYSQDLAPPLLAHSVLDPRLFGPPLLSPPIGSGSFSHQSSFSGLEGLGGDPGSPEMKRQKSL